LFTQQADLLENILDMAFTPNQRHDSFLSRLLFTYLPFCLKELANHY